MDAKRMSENDVRATWPDGVLRVDFLEGPHKGRTGIPYMALRPSDGLGANLAVPVRDGTDAVAMRLPYARLGTDWRVHGRSCTECLALRRA